MLPKYDWLVESVLQNGVLKLAWQAKLDLIDSGFASATHGAPEAIQKTKIHGDRPFLLGGLLQT